MTAHTCPSCACPTPARHRADVPAQTPTKVVDGRDARPLGWLFRKPGTSR